MRVLVVRLYFRTLEVLVLGDIIDVVVYFLTEFVLQEFEVILEALISLHEVLDGLRRIFPCDFICDAFARPRHMDISLGGGEALLIMALLTICSVEFPPRVILADFSQALVLKLFVARLSV